jgi:23S rRNA pseudouridine1911/1915/1917 synthase
LLVVAKTAAAQAGLGRAFQRRLVEKEYLAVTHGVPPLDHGHIATAIGREPDHPRRRCVDGLDARPASTSWRLADRARGFDASLLVCRPHSGRTHQIRVHLASIGLPLVGDRLYADRLYADQDARDLPPAALDFDRQALHAWRLRLRHPVSGADLEFVAPLPVDLRGLLATLGIEPPY